jgi:Na+-transporting methylmalonyl-CoA/oxaloacetate decarboxylase gamma subunit
MRKLVICVTISLIVLLMLALAVEAPKATEDTVKEPSPAVTAKEPVDSSQVIPKGPQWLGAPIMPDGTEVKKESGLLVTEYNLPYDKVLAWYQEALKKYPDARYRDWKQEMYIEDQGASRWHAIKISKTGGPNTTVTIRKDNWTWIIATLVIRFTGVFVVLLVLWLGLNAATFIMSRTIKEAKNGRAPSATT